MLCLICARYAERFFAMHARMPCVYDAVMPPPYCYECADACLFALRCCHAIIYGCRAAAACRHAAAVADICRQPRCFAAALPRHAYYACC